VKCDKNTISNSKKSIVSLRFQYSNKSVTLSIDVVSLKLIFCD